MIPFIRRENGALYEVESIWRYLCIFGYACSRYPLCTGGDALINIFRCSMMEINRYFAEKSKFREKGTFPYKF